MWFKDVVFYVYSGGDNDEDHDSRVHVSIKPVDTGVKANTYRAYHAVTRDDKSLIRFEEVVTPFEYFICA